MSWITINHKRFIQDYINKMYEQYKYQDDEKDPCSKKRNPLCKDCKKFCKDILNEECKEFEEKTGCDCKEQMKIKFQSFLHQEFLSEFMKEHTLNKEQLSRGLLIYHGLGSGKTCTSLLMSKAIRKASEKKMKIILLIQARLEIDPWKKELFGNCGMIRERKNQYASQKKFYELINNKYNTYIIHYNAFNVLKQKVDEVNFNNSIIIVDETHNFLNSLRNIDKTQRLKNPSFYLYSKIIKAKNSKLVLLTGTPIYNNPVELSYLFNMLTGNEKYMTIDFNTFNNKYIKEGEVINKNLLMNKFHGMISYFKGASEKAYAKKQQKMTKSPLTRIQDYIYQYLLTQASQFKYNVEDGTKFVIDNFARNKNRAKADLLLRYDKFMRTSNKESDNHFLVKVLEVCNIAFPKEIYNKYQKKGERQIKYLIADKYKNDPKDIYDDLNKMNFFDLKKLENYSSKFINIYKKIKESKGPVVVYSFFRELYGIHTFTEFLKAQGFKDAEKEGEGENRFMVWSGERTPKSEGLKDIFNQLDNSDGSKIKVFCMTSAGAEGISLQSIQQIHIMEPWWNYVLMKQIMGRGLRVCSHAHLPKEQQKLDVYLYYGSKLELFMVDIALKKYKRNQEFENLLKISSIDCYLNEKRNNLKLPCYSYEDMNEKDIINRNKLDDYNINLFKMIEKNGKKYYMDQTPLEDNRFKVFEYEEDINIFLRKKPKLVGILTMKLEGEFDIEFLEDTKKKLMELSGEKIDKELIDISRNLDLNIKGLSEEEVKDKICDEVKRKIIEKEMFED